VSDRPYEVAQLGELESLPGPGTLRWTPVRRRFGLTAFGINAYTAREPGLDVVEDHTERILGHEEVYVVVTGRATFELGGETFDAPVGTIVVIRDPATRRRATAAEANTTVLAVGGKPGTHDVSAWEWIFAGYGYADEGDLERGIEELEAALEAKPAARARVLYDLACLESRAGRNAAALDHLREAVELDSALGARAGDDPDFDPMRDDPAFPPATSPAT
jgi:tetratricopeptide (TPR) repeat protein